MNEPAYPSRELDQSTGQVCAQHLGMTLRDYFAVHSAFEADIPEELATELMGCDQPTTGVDNVRWWAEVAARYRYLCADAMLKAREEQPK